MILRSEEYADFLNLKFDQPGEISNFLSKIGTFCEIQAMKDENLVVQEYHDQWMAARTELLRCAGTIRKGW